MNDDFQRDLAAAVAQAAQSFSGSTKLQSFNFLYKAGILGLGPPVCSKCMVTTMFDVDTETWSCPICGNNNFDLHLLDCGLTEEELNNNELFLRFVTGKQDER